MTDDNLNEMLDELALEIGDVVDDNDKTLVTYTEKEIDNKLKKMTEKKFLYDDGNAIIPGDSMEDKYNAITESESKSIYDSVFAQVAMMKANKESEKLRKEEAQKKKEEFIANEMFYQEREYFKEYGHMMSGKEKRRIRRIISKRYDAGEFTPKGDGIPLN